MLKKLKIYIFSLAVLIALTACQTVTNKIDQTTELEKKELSKWLNKSEMDLKSFYGQPDKVEFLKTRNRNYVYFTEKYKITCERKFEVNPKNIVVGFSSKNCF
jgi:outer membrane protein assembly factor BamE (lipoprotein component of BamABCDE complex)